MKLIGIGLCLIGIGIIGYDAIIILSSRYIPKGKPPGSYEIDMEWEFPDE